MKLVCACKIDHPLPVLLPILEIIGIEVGAKGGYFACESHHELLGGLLSWSDSMRNVARERGKKEQYK